MMMSRIFLNRTIISRLYHSASESPRRRGLTPLAKPASKRFSAPQVRKNDEVVPRIKEFSPDKKFEPFPYTVTEENKLEVLKRVVTPLHDTPYQEQLSAKESYCRNTLRAIAQDIYRSGTPIRLDVSRLPCQVNKIVPSPQIYNYRSSVELTIWYGHDGMTETVGYNVFPISKHGDTVSVEPNGCPIMTDASIRMTDILQEFIRTQTKVGVSHSLGLEGGWRMFRICTNLKGDLMLTGFLNPRTLKVREVVDEKDLFRDFIVRRCREVDVNLVSLYYQTCPHNYCRHEEFPYELLHGEERLVDTIGQHSIRVSPDSFSHKNNIGSEILLETIRSTIKECFLTQDQTYPIQKPLILDAHSKAGVLSLYLSDLAQFVIGVDNRAMSVDDARTNAELNGIKNCEFINSNLEIVLERIVEKYCVRNNQEMMVVCEITPAGIHNSVIEVLLQCSHINKIVLVVTNINSMRTIQSITNLCLKGNKSHSMPSFAPILATPVDVSPLTESFTTVIALERLPR